MSPLPTDFAARLTALAGVVLRVGLNLQPGQPLLVTDPYDLQGIVADARGLADAIVAARLAEGGPAPEVLAPEVDLHALAERGAIREYEAVVERHTLRMHHHLQRGGAFLFLTGSDPQCLQGFPAPLLSRFEAAKWRHFGPLVQELIAGASQCTLLPAPSPAWATLAGRSLPALWDAVFDALRIPADGGNGGGPIEDWHRHLDGLDRRCAELNATRPRTLRYTGPGTDLSFAVPRSHRWCTTRLRTRTGLRFVFNLPTEEVFTAPHRNSAEGRLHVARPVAHTGTVMAGIDLEFRQGRVVAAHAESGGDLLRELLATDAGASRIGEVALLPGENPLSRCTQPFHHVLLDENASPHVALGCSYRFCSTAWIPLALNPSQIHVDLPLAADVHLA